MLILASWLAVSSVLGAIRGGYVAPADEVSGDTSCRRLLAIPGPGALVATAIVVAVVDGRGFRRVRDHAAWRGFIRRQPSTGDKSTLLGTSSRGNGHVRRPFIHGARSASMHTKRDRGLGSWLGQLKMRTHENITLVALANKIVRISREALARREEYWPPVSIAA